MKGDKVKYCLELDRAAHEQATHSLGQALRWSGGTPDGALAAHARSAAATRRDKRSVTMDADKPLSRHTQRSRSKRSMWQSSGGPPMIPR